jgi:hypothetical protein
MTIAIRTFYSPSPAIDNGRSLLPVLVLNFARPMRSCGSRILRGTMKWVKVFE